MDRKKVFLVRNVLGFGGGELYQVNLAKMLRKYGFEPVIVTNSSELTWRAEKSGYEVLIPPYIKNQNWSGARNLLLPIYFMKLYRLKRWYEEAFRQYRPWVVNAQSRDDFIAATAVAEKCGVRVLWTDHADFKSWVFTNVDIKYKNLIGKLIIDISKEAEKVIFVSERVFEETRKMIGSKKIKNAEVIRNGVFDAWGEYEGIKSDKKSFVFIGRVVEEKGIAELLVAFSKVREKYPEATLKIYGVGEIERFKKLAGEGVLFCGETKEPLRALAENEIFVLPSYREGLSLSLLDAAMMGKTIIASDVDGNPEVVEDGISGILMPARDVDKLAEAMEKVLAEPKLAKRLATGARKKYEKEFDFEKIFAEKMLPLYNNEKEMK